MDLPHEKNIKCSNYVGETIDMAIDMGVKGNIKKVIEHPEIGTIISK